MQAFLVIDRSGPEPVHVFLEKDTGLGTAGAPAAEPVTLDLLRGHVGRVVLSRSVRDPRLYREFRSDAELLVAGYEPVGPYRVCSTWQDYLAPWSPPRPDQPTERMTDDG